MSSQIPFHHHLLRPAIIHILRAAGFHSTRPSVLDTLTDLAARYLSLLAQRTAYFVYDRTTSDASDLKLVAESDDTAAAAAPSPLPLLRSLDADLPTITDIRLAMSSCAVFTSSDTATEEIWQEMLRKPITVLPAVAQEKERRRRDYEDTKDVQEFLDWVTGPANQEILRIAGLVDEHSAVVAGAGTGVAAGSGAAAAPTIADLVEPREDYLAQMKKKRSKTGESSRFAGTALGKVEDRGGVKIEGGPESMEQWQVEVKKRRLEGLEEEASRKRKETLV